jgi:hypothetical protein
MKKLPIILVAVVLATSANAATMSTTYNTGVFPGVNNTMTVDSFTGSNLTAVDYTYTFNYEAIGFIINKSANNTIANIKFSATATNADLGPITLSATEQFTLAGKEGMGFGRTGSVDFTGNSTDLSAFQSGPINVGVSMFTGMTGGNFVKLSMLSFGDVSLKVSYTFDASPASVPIPLTLPLLATAFAALGIMATLRKST